MTESILSIDDLKVHYPIRKGVLKRTVGHVKAVDGVTLNVRRGEILGVVGESGCGKTTLGKSLLRLAPITAGSAVYESKEGPIELAGASGTQLDSIRSRLQIVLQDPYSSLNPTLTIFESLRDPLAKYRTKVRSEQREILAQLFAEVNLPTDFMDRYPNEFSGGQRQRIGIVRALCVNPELIMCDEAVSALDVSVQAQALNLLKDLSREKGLTYLFISHNMSVVEYISDRIAVMYLGRIVELADAADIYSSAKHPYTRALLSAIPSPQLGSRKDRIVLRGDVPSPADPPSGCTFRTRCPFAQEICALERPPLRLAGEGTPHQVACHFAEEIDTLAASIPGWEGRAA